MNRQPNPQKTYKTNTTITQLFLTFFVPPDGANTPNHDGYGFYHVPNAHTHVWSQTSRSMDHPLRDSHDHAHDQRKTPMEDWLVAAQWASMEDWLGGALPSNAKQGPDPLWNFPNLQLYGQMAAHDSGIRKKKRTMQKWDDQHEVNFSSSFVPAPSRRRVRKVWRSPSPAGFSTSRGPPCIFWCPVSKDSPFFTAPKLVRYV